MGAEVFVYDQIDDITFESNKLFLKKKNLILKKLLLHVEPGVMIFKK